jgi:recombination DNA repair RAD52 pathway protein
MNLTTEQVNELKKAIDPQRVKTLQGFSYIEIWDVRRLLNVIFGFAGWSADTTEMILVSEEQMKTKTGSDAYRVIYRAKCSLRIGDAFGDGASYTEWAAGTSINPSLADAHDNAIKNAESGALKRCAVNLGDQFGLSLYKDGSTEATVIETLTEEFADADKVGAWMLKLANAGSEKDLIDLAAEIRGAGICKQDNETLINEYRKAMERVKAA